MHNLSVDSPWTQFNDTVFIQVLNIVNLVPGLLHEKCLYIRSTIRNSKPIKMIAKNVTQFFYFIHLPCFNPFFHSGFIKHFEFDNLEDHVSLVSFLDIKTVSYGVWAKRVYVLVRGLHKFNFVFCF